MSSLDWLVCPRCQQHLDEHETCLVCPSCEVNFPVYIGIPDMRLGKDCAGAWREEEELLPRLVEKYYDLDLAQLLEVMLDGLYDKSEKDREHLREYFVRGLAERSKKRIQINDRLLNKFEQTPNFSNCLEVGCGAGATLFQLALKGKSIGVDPNLLHLIIAKKHAESIGRQVRLVCAHAERMPFPDACFSFINFTHTFEHFTDQKQGLAEVARILSPRGVTCFDVPNRFSLWREPHTMLWGIGFLPRKWTPLSTIQNRSLWELRKLLGESFGSNYRIFTMLIRFEAAADGERRFINVFGRTLGRVEHAPLIGSLIRFFQPGFEIVAYKNST